MDYVAHNSFTFTSLVDFRKLKNPEEMRKNAEEFGLVVMTNGLHRSDIRVIQSASPRFKKNVFEILTGTNDSSFHARKMEIVKDSNLKLYYYDLKSHKEAIVEILRRPGLEMCFRSGNEVGFQLCVHVVHTDIGSILVDCDYGTGFEIA